MRRLLVAFFFVATGLAAAQVPTQIPITGVLGPNGNFCMLGCYNLVLSSDANYTPTVTELANREIIVTSSVSLTATRSIILPNVSRDYVIVNKTTGGHSIQIIGASGSGVTIANSFTQSVTFDGTNFVNTGGGVTVPLILNGTSANATNIPESSTYAHIFDTSTYTVPQLTSGFDGEVQSFFSISAYGPSLDLGNAGGWRVVQGSYMQGTFAERGISQGSVSFLSKHAVGDFTSGYQYAYSDGGTSAQSDEAIEGFAVNSGETSGYYHGTISSTTGTGDIQPVLSTATSGNNWTTDGAFVLDITKGTISGNYTGASTAFGSTYLHQLPVSNSLPLSSAWGQLTIAIPNPGVTPNNSATLTATVNLGTIGSSTPAFTTGVACITGPNYPEKAHITSVGAASGSTQSITFTYHNPNGTSGTSSTYPILFQGGVCGQYISEDANLAFSGYRTSYYAFGSTTGNNLVYGVNLAGSLSSQTLPMVSEAQTTTSGYHLYPGAEIVENTSTGAAPILEYNAVAWAAGDVVENPHYPMVNTEGEHIAVVQNTPTNNAYSALRSAAALGDGVAGINYLGDLVNNANPSSIYKDFSGPVNTPFCAYCVEGYWTNGIDIQSGPAVGGSVITLEANEKVDTTPFDIFFLHNGPGSGAAFGYNPATTNFTMTNGLNLGNISIPGAPSGSYVKADGTGYGTPAGSGNVAGPSSSTVGHYATFANTTGTLIADGGALGTAAALTASGTGTNVPTQPATGQTAGHYIIYGTGGSLVDGGAPPAAVGTAAQVPVVNSGATSYVPVTITGDATLTSSGALTVTKTSGTAFGPAATATSASTTVNGQACALAGTCSITAVNPNAITFAATGGAAAGTSTNGEAAVTVDASTVGADYKGQINGAAVPGDTPSSGGPVTLTAAKQIVASPTVDYITVIDNSYGYGEGVQNPWDSFVGLLRQDTTTPVINSSGPGAQTAGYAKYIYSQYIPSTLRSNFVLLGGPENDASYDGTSPATPTTCAPGANSASINDYCATVRATEDWALNGPEPNRLMASNWVQTSGTWAFDSSIPLPTGSTQYQFASPGTAMFINGAGVLTGTATIPANVSQVNFNYTSYNSGGSTSFGVTVKVGSAAAVSLLDPCSGTTTITTIHCYSRTPGAQGSIPYSIAYTFTPSAAPQTVIVTVTNSAGVMAVQSFSWQYPGTTAATSTSISSGTPGSAIVFQRSSNVQFTNYAAYNAAAKLVTQEFLTAGMPAYYVDLVNGVTLANCGSGVTCPTYAWTTADVSQTATASTTTTPGVSGSVVPNHLNTHGMTIAAQGIEAQAANVGLNLFTHGAGRTTANSMSQVSYGPIKFRLSQGTQNFSCQVTMAATLNLTGCLGQGGLYELNGATAATFIPVPTDCNVWGQGCVIYFYTQNAVTFGTGGNISAAASFPASTMIMAVYEYNNPYNTATAPSRWGLFGMNTSFTAPVSAQGLIGNSAVPTIANTTGTTAVVTGSTNTSGTLTSSTSGTVTFVLTWGSSLAYPHRGVCSFTDETTAADAFSVHTTAATTTTLTASGTTVSGDTISYQCSGY